MVPPLRCQTYTVAAVVSLLMLASAGCGDSSTTTRGKASLSISLTDAPGLRDALVEITSIYLESGAPNAKRIHLLDHPTGLIDVVRLADQTRLLVQEARVPSGEYTALRFVFGNAVIVTDEGGVYATPGIRLSKGLTRHGTLRCPTCDETGFAVNLPAGALKVDTESKDLVVDFDVRHSFVHRTGPARTWELRPMLYASDMHASGSLGGSVVLNEGVTLPQCGGTQIELSDFAPLAAAGGFGKPGRVRHDGSYKVPFLQPGHYEVSLRVARSFDNGETLSFRSNHPSSVTIQPGATAVADFLLTAVSCERPQIEAS